MTYSTKDLDLRRVSCTFRTAALELLPGLELNEAYRRLFLVLTPFAAWTEDPTADDQGQLDARIVLPRPLLAACAGADLSTHRFVGTELLASFERDVGVPLNLSPWSSAGKARTAAPRWPERLLTLIDEELKRPYRERKCQGVRFVSGVKVTTTRQRDEAARLRQLSVQEYTQALVRYDTPARDLLHYANEESDRAFWTLLENNIEYARFVAGNLTRQQPDGQPDDWATQQLRQRNLATLHALESQPVPVYKPGTTSPRIFAVGQSALGLSRDVRRALMSGCSEFDLKFAQYAVAVKVLDLDEGQQFLSSGGHLWTELLTHMGVAGAEAKKLLKKAVYSALFGMGRANIRRNLCQGVDNLPGLGEDAARHFFEHPLVMELLEAREQALDDLQRDGLGKTCFGLTIPVQDREDARTVLAAQMQSWELKLMLPVLDALKAHPSVTLVAYQHDGFTVTHRRERDKVQFEAAVTRAVARKAQELGIQTGLESETLHHTDLSTAA